MQSQDSTIRIETDARKFMQTLSAWSPEAAPFNECLMTGLLHLSLFDVRPSFIEVLAGEFEVGRGTVLRWAQGVERPHFILQRRVVAGIQRELELALSPGRA